MDPSKTNKTLLHVGPGRARIGDTTQGFNDGTWQELRYDIDATVGPDIIGTMTDMSKVPNATVDAIYSSHNLEHLYPHEVQVALVEFHRVLNPQGFVVLTCPDLKSVSQHIVDDKLEDPLYKSPAGPIAPLDILYGHRASLARGNLYMAHRTGFTAKTLIKAFLAAKFSSVYSMARPSFFDLWIIASKGATDADQMKQLATLHFP